MESQIHTFATSGLQSDSSTGCGTDEVKTRGLEFEDIETLLKGKLHVALTKSDERIVKWTQGYVTLEKGKYKNEPAHRLVIGRSNISGFGHSRKQIILLTKENVHGIVNGSECKRIIYSWSYCPAITIVTADLSVILTFVTYNEVKRKRKFDTWSETIRKELDFGGYWPIQEVTLDELPVTSSGAASLLCATRTKLSILTRLQTGTYVSKVTVAMETMIRSERHNDVTRNEVRLAMTFSVNHNYIRLACKIKNDQSMTKDLFDILDKIKIPVRLRDETRRDYKDILSRRISKDDLDLLPLVPRKCTWRQRRKDIPVYDLNAISRENSVLDAIHFYENIQVIREKRNPPDVVIKRPSSWETKEYWDIVSTLTEVLRKRTPTPDTLNLPCKLRRTLCFSLLDNTLPSWKDLADYLGLTQEAVRMTETLFQSGIDLNPCNANDILTPPECLLRHWQFAHNQHTMGLQSKAPPYPCSKASLSQILCQMERHDLVKMLQ